MHIRYEDIWEIPQYAYKCMVSKKVSWLDKEKIREGYIRQNIIIDYLI